MKRVLVVTGGGDCPGLNAVIRAIVKRASQEKDWEVIGSIQSYDGILREPTEIMILDEKAVAGIHVQGGTIIGTTNKGGPFAWPGCGAVVTGKARVAFSSVKPLCRRKRPSPSRRRRCVPAWVPVGRARSGLLRCLRVSIRTKACHFSR